MACAGVFVGPADLPVGVQPASANGSRIKAGAGSVRRRKNHEAVNRDGSNLSTIADDKRLAGFRAWASLTPMTPFPAPRLVPAPGSDEDFRAPLDRLIDLDTLGRLLVGVGEITL